MGQKFGKGSAGQFTLGVSHVVHMSCSFRSLTWQAADAGRCQGAQLGLGARSVSTWLCQHGSLRAAGFLRGGWHPLKPVSNEPGVSYMIFSALTL